MHILYNVKTRMALIATLALTLTATSCREDETVIASDTQQPGAQTAPSEIVGMYVLCEGNMGSNKATVDYLDLAAADGYVAYHRNIFPERNPSEVMELGDVGNDIKVSGDKLWMVINCSHKVVVATVDSCRKVAQINIPNCRYVTFDGAYAYVSSYVGPVEVGGARQLGRVYKVDTLTYAKVDSVVVGYQPEEMAVVGGSLYVANSGGYLVDGYETTVSEVDLATFTEVRRIHVAPNLHRLRADNRGQLWVSSRGDYVGVASRLYCLDNALGNAMQVVDSVDVAVSDFSIVGDSLYYIGVEWSYATNDNAVSHGIVDVASRQQVADAVTTAPEFADIVLPYGIIVNPIHRDFYVMDAKNYLSSGQLFHFLADGTYDWRVDTGDIPAHAAFVYE